MSMYRKKPVVIQGEVYNCEPSIFAATYEAVIT